MQRCVPDRACGNAAPLGRRVAGAAVIEAG